MSADPVIGERATCPTCGGAGTVEIADVDAAAVTAWAEFRNHPHALVRAVKRVREVTGCSLLEAKRAVERAQFPLLSVSVDE